MIRLGNNEVLKTLTKTLTFVDADDNANANTNANANAKANTGGSTTALRERCSGKLIKDEALNKINIFHISSLKHILWVLEVFQKKTPIYMFL